MAEIKQFARKRKPMSKSVPIAYRLSEDKHRQLLGLAMGAGLSPGDFTRELVLAKLDEAAIMQRGIETVGEEVEVLKSELASLRRDFALAVEALLVSNSAGKPITVEQAKRWVDERIRSKAELHKSH